MECSRFSVKHSMVAMKSFFLPVYEKQNKNPLLSLSSSGEGDPGNPEKCALIFFF